MRRSGAVVALGAVLLVVLGLWVTSADRVDLFHGAGSPGAPATREAVPQQSSTDEAEPPPPVRPADTSDSGFILVVLYVALVVFCLILLAVVVRKLWGWRRRRRMKRRAGGATDPTTQGVPDVPAELVAVTETQHDALLRGTARNAIVACWVALEDAAADAGLTRRASETSLEFTARVLSSHTVDSSAISRLAALYREARFSEHPITEDHRDRAIAALRRLDGELRASRPAADPISQGQRQ